MMTIDLYTYAATQKYRKPAKKVTEKERNCMVYEFHQSNYFRRNYCGEK